MSLFIQNNNGPVYNDCTVTIVNGEKPSVVSEVRPNSDHAEEVEPIDTSFFCTRQFTADIIEKNIRQAIELASSKADACRRIMALETQGYVVLSNVKDEQKAAFINPFAVPKYTLTGEDFKKARNR